MKKGKVKARLAEMISGLNEIILCEGKQAYGIQALKKCRDSLQKVYNDFDKSRKKINYNALLLRVYRLIDCLYFCVKGG